MKNIKKNEQGRSMVEMLGVLAIIGVLSIGGIAGYTYAMNNYRTNELVEGILQRAYTVTAQLMSGRNPSLAEFNGLNETAEGTFADTVIELKDADNKKTNEFAIKISNVKPAVCKNMIKLATESNVIKAITKENNYDVSLPETDCTAAGSTFFVVFNNDLTP